MYLAFLPLIASFAVFCESLGIITHDFVCIVALHPLEKDSMIISIPCEDLWPCSNIKLRSINIISLPIVGKGK